MVMVAVVMMGGVVFGVAVGVAIRDDANVPSRPEPIASGFAELVVLEQLASSRGEHPFLDATVSLRSKTTTSVLNAGVVISLVITASDMPYRPHASTLPSIWHSSADAVAK